MVRVKLVKLLERLEDEIKIAKKRAGDTHTAASEIARAAASSPSQSGDRTHAEGQALLSKKLLTELNNLKSEVMNFADKDVPTLVEVPCYLEVVFSNGEKREFYLVRTPVNICGVNLVSRESLLGQVVQGRKVGDEFELKKEGQQGRAGEVLKVE